MKKLNKKEYQALWVYAALERLQNLGFIQGADYNLTPDGIDQFLVIDDHRHVLFDDEKDFEILISLICRDKNVAQKQEDVDGIIQIVRDFRDRREDLVKFALTSIITK